MKDGKSSLTGHTGNQGLVVKLSYMSLSYSHEPFFKGPSLVVVARKKLVARSEVLQRCQGTAEGLPPIEAPYAWVDPWTLCTGGSTTKHQGIPDFAPKTLGTWHIKRYVRSRGRTYLLWFHTAGILNPTAFQCKFQLQPQLWSLSLDIADPITEGQLLLTLVLSLGTSTHIW